MFKLVHYAGHTSIGKRAGNLPLKGLLVIYRLSCHGANQLSPQGLSKVRILRPPFSLLLEKLLNWQNIVKLNVKINCSGY